MGESSADVFDRAAAVYDEAVPFFATFARRLVSAAALVEHDPLRRILDLGAGGGAVCLAAAEVISSDVEIIAADTSPGMLARLKALPVTNLRARRLDANALDLEDGAIDAVLAGFVLHILPDPRTALGEISRVLAPSGLLGFSVAAPSDDGGWWSRYGQIVAAYTATLSDQAPPGMTGPPVRWRALLQDADLCVLRSNRTELALPIDGPETHWRWLLSHGNRWLYDALPPHQREMFRTDVLDSLRTGHPSGGKHIIAGADLVVSRKRP